MRWRLPILDEAAYVDGDLTGQETKFPRLLSVGLTNAELGNALLISPKTASVHVSNILHELPVRKRTEVTAWANCHGLTDSR